MKTYFANKVRMRRVSQKSIRGFPLSFSICLSDFEVFAKSTSDEATDKRNGFYHLVTRGIFSTILIAGIWLLNSSSEAKTNSGCYGVVDFLENKNPLKQPACSHREEFLIEKLSFPDMHLSYERLEILKLEQPNFWLMYLFLDDSRRETARIDSLLISSRRYELSLIDTLGEIGGERYLIYDFYRKSLVLKYIEENFQRDLSGARELEERVLEINLAENFPNLPAEKLATCFIRSDVIELGFLEISRSARFKSCLDSFE